MAHIRDALDTLLSDGVIAYHASFAKHFGGVKAAVLLSQLYYWRDKGSDPDGWIYKTIDEIEDETGLTYREQRTARKKLVEAGVLEEELRGLPAQLYYRVNTDVLVAKLSGVSDVTNRNNSALRNVTSSPYVSEEHYMEPETTTETTTKNTNISFADAKNSARTEFDQLFPQSEDLDGAVDEPLPGESMTDYRARMHDQRVAARQSLSADSPWVFWCAGKVKPRRGISAESLQRVGWLLEDLTGLRPEDGTFKHWINGLADMYQAGRGDMALVRAGIEKAWSRDRKFRPTDPVGFAKQIRKEAAMAKTPEEELEMARRRYAEFASQAVAGVGYQGMEHDMQILRDAGEL